MACPCTGPDGTPSSLAGWWRDRADFASADVVEIRANEVTVLDFSLRLVGQLPEPSPPPQPPPTTPSEELPFTGQQTVMALLTASCLLLIGAGLLQVGRWGTRPR